VVGGFSSSTALWVCALLLMLGTAGVLITAKIALAALLAIGPLFVTLALFTATRGLFEGWLKAIVLFALVPMLAVLIGGGAVGALTPLVQRIALSGGQPAPRDVAILFLGTCVYLALMVMVMKTASTIVAGWRLPGERSRDAGDASRPIMAPANLPAPTGTSLPGMPAVTARGNDDRMRQIVSSLSSHGDARAGSDGTAIGRSRAVSAQIVSIGGETARVAHSSGRRIQGIGSRFRLQPATLSKGHVS
jgi:type IV secretion system protein VirB6